MPGLAAKADGIVVKSNRLLIQLFALYQVRFSITTNPRIGTAKPTAALSLTKRVPIREHSFDSTCWEAKPPKTTINSTLSTFKSSALDDLLDEAKAHLTIC